MPELAVVGHDAGLRRLEAAVREGRLTHALLLSGPPSVGKTTVAMRLAGLLLDEPAWPREAGAHPDLWLEDGPLEHVGIGRMRAGGGREAGEPSLQEFLSLRSYGGGRKVAIVARADRLTLEAANSVLRTVEEPPPGSHLILAAAHPERLPPTLLSRLQAVTLGPVPQERIAGWLVDRHGMNGDLAGTAAALAAGRPGRALRLATDGDALARELAVLDRFLETPGAGVAAAVRAADALAPPADSGGRERSVIQLGIWAEFVRDVLCRVVGRPQLCRGLREERAASGWSSLPPWRLTSMLHHLVIAADELERNANPKLCYEALFLDLSTRAPAPRGPAGTISGAGRSGSAR